MVFCGKPSRGCYACRKRKTRCDQRPEGCTQCERARRHCPGYRVLGLNIRDESENVIRKAKAREAMPVRTKQGRKEVEASSTSLGTQSPEDDSEDDAKGSIKALQPSHSPSASRSVLPIGDANSQVALGVSRYILDASIDDRAIVFFISNYIIGHDGPTRGHLNYLKELYNMNTMDEGLEASMKAVGFAGFSHVANAPDLMTNARCNYVKALRLTNAALTIPDKAKEDTTLIAVMVLSLFELVAGSTQRSLEAWTKHIEGACALLKLRGHEQLRKASGRRMFLQVVTSLMNICIQCGKPLPEFIIEWAWEAKKDLLPTNNPVWLVQQAMMDFTAFQASFFDKTCSDPEEVFTRALELDTRFGTIFDPIPPDWEYQVVYTSEESDVVYDGYYHIYDNYWMANMWNAIRTIRILLHRTMRSAILEGRRASPPVLTKPEHTEQIHDSMRFLYKFQREILETIPQHFGFGAPPGSPSSNASSNDLQASPMPWYYFRDRNYENFPVLRSGGPHFLLASLRLVGSMDISTQPVRAFVIKVLRLICEQMGIQQAGVVANILEKKSKLRIASGS